MNTVKISGPPTETELLIPANEDNLTVPEISIVVPALDEQITIGEFIDWCRQGLREAGVSGEIIIVDSSSDNTPNIALSKGAYVLRTPKRGLGQAYLDAVPFIRGNFIIMGDCDLTYDFREIKPFINEFRCGAQYVMGSRFIGSIEDGAMPPLHRYFGTPLTTWILNLIYSSDYSDIHCGMRGLTREALEKINLTSTGWEYASEMVLKASRLGLKISEVPVKFYRDREGRISHHRRAGFWSPWYAGWINLKVMLVYSPDTFLLKPGFAIAMLGMLISVLSMYGGVTLGHLGFGNNMLLGGGTLVVLGYAMFQTGILARRIHSLRSGIENLISEKLTYDRGMFFGILLVTVGAMLALKFVVDFVSNDYLVKNNENMIMLGLFLIMLGVQTMGFVLLLELKRRMQLKNEEGA
jgi:glycosyltransferase involved in cell wall biosynthesis